jgi:hypothetical protein
MDWSDQPAAPVPPSTPSPFTSASISPAPGPGASATVESAAHPLLGGARRTVTIALLAVGLLTVGGAAVVFAADPSVSPAPNASTQPSTGGGTTRPNGQAPGHNAADCPNMGGSSGPGSAPGSSAAPSTNGSTSSPSL